MSSWYYNEIQSPMCDYIVKLLPVTLAPNVITLAGFFCVFFCLVIMWLFFGLQAEGPVDGWFKCMTGVLFFMYTVFDNMDGKQARRCGSGSPMGMLVDHGFDAITAIMASILQPRFFQIGNGPVAFICFLMPTIPFYYCNFSEYYTGVLHLPAISGPDESELLFCILCFVSAYVGDDLLSDLKVNFGLGEQKFSHVLAYFIAIFEIASILSHTYSSLTNAKNEPHFKSRFNLTKFVQQALFMPVLVGVWAIYMVTTPGSQTRDELCLMACLGYSAQFLQTAHRMLVCDVTLASFNPFRRTQLLSWGLLFVNAACLHTTQGKTGFMDEYILLLGINVISWGAVFHQIYYTITDMCRILDINCFSIKYPEKLKKIENEGKKA